MVKNVSHHVGIGQRNNHSLVWFNMAGKHQFFKCAYPVRHSDHRMPSALLSHHVMNQLPLPFFASYYSNPVFRQLHWVLLLVELVLVDLNPHVQCYRVFSLRHILNASTVFCVKCHPLAFKVTDIYIQSLLYFGSARVSKTRPILVQLRLLKSESVSIFNYHNLLKLLTYMYSTQYVHSGNALINNKGIESESDVVKLHISIS